MRLVALRGQIVTDYEVWPDGTVLLGDGSIADVSLDDSLVDEADEVHYHPESLILPGFVDLQVNGAFGVDVASESARLPELSEALLSTGTTSYLPTVISSPESLYEDVLPAIGTSIGSGAEVRSEEHTSELQSHSDLVCRLLLEKKKKKKNKTHKKNTKRHKQIYKI